MITNNIKSMSTPEKLELLSDVRVVEHGETLADGKKKGDVVTVSGEHKAELLGRKLATREITPTKGKENK